MRILFIFFFQLIFGSCMAQHYPDLIPYEDHNQWGYRDSNNIIKITPRYKSADLFGKNNTAVVMLDDTLAGIINKKGDVLFTIRGGFYCFRDFYFRENDNYRYQQLDPTGKPLSNYVYYLKPEAYLGDLNSMISDNCIIMKDSAMNIVWDFGLIDQQGKTLIPFNCMYIKPLNDTLLACTQYYYFRDFKTYSAKQLRYMKKHFIENDSCLVKLNLYTIKGRFIKTLARETYRDKYDAEQGFLLYPDFFIDHRDPGVYDPLSYPCEMYNLYNYNGDLVSEDLKLSYSGSFDIAELEAGFYKIMNEHKQYAIYDSKHERFISDFIFNDIVFFNGSVGKVILLEDCYNVQYNGQFSYSPAKFSWQERLQLLSKKFCDEGLYDETWLNNDLPVHKFLTVTGQPYFPADSPLNKINAATNADLQFFQSYYYVPNYGWFDYHHHLVHGADGSGYYLATPYDKLFIEVDRQSYYYSFQHPGYHYSRKYVLIDK